MATDAANLATIKSNALERLAELSASPKPSYSIDGQQFSWAEYQKLLMDQVAWCDQQLAAETPVEVITQGYT